MRIALISDIHGNLVALDAVLTDIARKEVDQIVCLGDVATLGPQPCGVLARLKTLDCLCVLGNHETELLNLDSAQVSVDVPSLVSEWMGWCASQLTKDDLEYLRFFQPLVEISLDSAASLLCFHGSPRSNTDFILASTPTTELEEMLAGYTATVMACGHTHMQMLRRHREKTIVNSGSVGWPLEQLPFKDRPRYMPWSEYAIVSWTDGNLEIELCRIPIDLKKVKQAALASNMPRANIWLKYWKALERG